MTEVERLKDEALNISIEGFRAASRQDWQGSYESFLKVKPLFQRIYELTGDKDYLTMIEKGEKAHRNKLH